MRRTGSAAPQSSWSPTEKALRYSGPRFILRSLPTGMSRVPVTRAGVSSFRVSSLVLATRETHSLWPAMACSISPSGMSRFSLMVKAWL